MNQHQVPVLGINLGKLGFLADIQPEEIETVLPDVIAVRCRVIDHLMFQCEVVRDGKTLVSRLGLNETAILGGPPFALMDVELLIDDEPVTTYRCDGLIISTPVGSTAHNLSAGGPILRKNLEAFVISAVSPHALTVRPVVDTADRIYELRATNSPDAPHVVVDGVEIHQLSTPRSCADPACCPQVSADRGCGTRLLPYASGKTGVGRTHAEQPHRSTIVTSPTPKSGFRFWAIPAKLACRKFRTLARIVSLPS